MTRSALRLYARHGRAALGGADFFTLVGLDETGQPDGSGCPVCASCIREVAMDTLAVLTGRRAWYAPAVAPALNSIGQRHGYTIQGHEGTCPAERCGECGGLLGKP